MFTYTLNNLNRNIKQCIIEMNMKYQKILLNFVLVGFTLTSTTTVIPSSRAYNEYQYFECIFSEFFAEAIPSEVIDPPSTDITIYVDAQNGDDNNDGLSEESALKTLK